MRILAVADLHYALRQFDWVGEHLDGIDLLVIAGDLLDLRSPVELDVQEIVVKNYLRRFAEKHTLLASSGNHDIRETPGRQERSADWMASRGVIADYASHERDGVLFTVCPWWDGPESRAKTERRIDADAAKDKHTWIWLHHNPPAGTPVAWTGTGHRGDPVALGWIEKYQPDFVFSGHIHNAPFYAAGSWHSRVGKSIVFNAGRQPGREPTRIVLDLALRRAEWFSIEAIETLEF